MSDAAIIAAAGIVTTFLVNLFQERRVNKKFEQQEAAAERRRLWMKQDAEDRAVELAKQTASVAAELKQETRQQAKELGDKLDINTELTGKAYDAANNFDVKLERLAKVFDSVHTDKEVSRQLLEMAADTNQAILSDIQPDVAAIKDAVTHVTHKDPKDAG